VGRAASSSAKSSEYSEFVSAGAAARRGLDADDAAKAETLTEPLAAEAEAEAEAASPEASSSLVVA
jgi:hypothetical protein